MNDLSLTHTGSQLNSEKLFFLCLVSLQTVGQGHSCTPIRQWIWTRNKMQIVLLVNYHSYEIKNGSNLVALMVELAHPVEWNLGKNYNN